MAANRWVGGTAQSIAQVNSLLVGGTVATNQVYSVVMGLNSSKTVSYTASNTDTNATIAAALLALLQASIIPEFQSVLWSAGSSTVITGTSATAGVPFTNTSSATGTGTLVTATTTASAGPNDWGVAANWSTGAVPVTGDDVYLDLTSVDIYYSLDQHSVTLNSLNISASFAAGSGSNNLVGNGTVGLPEQNASGYLEYRPTYLKIGVTTVNIGRGVGSGSGRIKLDLYTVQSTVNVYNTGTGLDANVQALCLKGTNASNVFNIYGGLVQIAGFGGETATVATLVVGPTNPAASDPGVVVGAGTTLTTLTMESGTGLQSCGCTTVTIKGGTLTVLDSPTGTASSITTLNAAGGLVDYQGSGTIGTLKAYTSASSVGSVTFDSVNKSRTVSACSIYPGAQVSDRYGSVTWSSGLTFVECTMAGATLRENISITVTYN